MPPRASMTAVAATAEVTPIDSVRRAIEDKNPDQLTNALNKLDEDTPNLEAQLRTIRSELRDEKRGLANNDQTYDIEDEMLEMITDKIRDLADPEAGPSGPRPPGSP